MRVLYEGRASEARWTKTEGVGEERTGVRRKEREIEKRIENHMMRVVAAAHYSLREGGIKENQPNCLPSVRWQACR